MKSLFTGILATCLMVIVASCTTLDAKIQETAPSICRTIEKGHLVFVSLAVGGIISQNTVEKEAKAYAVAQPYCLNPSTLTSSDLLILTAQQLIILKAAKDAENG